MPPLRPKERQKGFPLFSEKGQGRRVAILFKSAEENYGMIALPDTFKEAFKAPTHLERVIRDAAPNKFFNPDAPTSPQVWRDYLTKQGHYTVAPSPKELSREYQSLLGKALEENIPLNRSSHPYVKRMDDILDTLHGEYGFNLEHDGHPNHEWSMEEVPYPMRPHWDKKRYVPSDEVRYRFRRFYHPETPIDHPRGDRPGNFTDVPLYHALSGDAPLTRNDLLAFFSREPHREMWNEPGDEENYDYIGDEEYHLPGYFERPRLYQIRHSGIKPHYGHFDEFAIAHARMSDRRLARDPETYVLLHDENQSDRHQHGSKYGYSAVDYQNYPFLFFSRAKDMKDGSAPLPSDSIEDALQKYESSPLTRHYGSPWVHPSMNVLLADEKWRQAAHRRDAFTTDEAELAAANKEVEARKAEAITHRDREYEKRRAFLDNWDADDLSRREWDDPRWEPFSPTFSAPHRRDWEETMIKRLLYHAAAKGYDGYAWSTGQNQIDRYPGEHKKPIEELHYVQMDEKPDGTPIFDVFAIVTPRNPEAYQPEEREISKSGLTPKDLQRWLGEENAQKILDSVREGNGEGMLTDGHWGGYGLRVAYDERHKDIVHRLLAPHTPDGKVPYRMETLKRDADDLPETPERMSEMVEREEQRLSVYQDRQEQLERLLSETSDPERRAMVQHTLNATVSNLRQVERELKRLTADTRVHYVEITPAMRASILRNGFPLWEPPRMKKAIVVLFSSRLLKGVADADLKHRGRWLGRMQSAAKTHEAARSRSKADAAIASQGLKGMRRAQGVWVTQRKINAPDPAKNGLQPAERRRKRRRGKSLRVAIVRKR